MRRTLRTLSWSLIVAGAVALAGCGGTPELPVDETYDPAAAKTALVTALDAWRDGKAAGLGKGSPPIRFSDDDVYSGLKLERYELLDAETPIAAFRDVRVKLFLKNPAGQSYEREATYQVSLSPILAVMRSDG